MTRTASDTASGDVWQAWLDRAQVEIGGKDRARLLHGLCTNDIKGLKPGEGCEVFLTDAQGHTIGHGFVFSGPDSLWYDTVPGESERVIRNLDRYVVREDVSFADRSESSKELVVWGPGANEKVRDALGGEPPDRELGHRDQDFSGDRVSVRRTSYCGPGSFQLSGSHVVLEVVAERLAKDGVLSRTEDDVDAARIEAGTPLFGRDITEQNLPQEIDRDSMAISFTKGCYIGQETVARIDSLGHVNRLLRGLKFTGSSPPPAGAEILRDGKLIARTTSSCFSPRLQAPLCLAYVRRGHHSPGTRLETVWGDAEVLCFPLQAPT
jgi:folate-binding protein YgfZ